MSVKPVIINRSTLYLVTSENLSDSIKILVWYIPIYQKSGNQTWISLNSHWIALQKAITSICYNRYYIFAKLQPNPMVSCDAMLKIVLSLSKSKKAGSNSALCALYSEKVSV